MVFIQMCYSMYYHCFLSYKNPSKSILMVLILNDANHTNNSNANNNNNNDTNTEIIRMLLV